MPLMNKDDEAKLASSRFRDGRVYRRQQIEAASAKVVEVQGTLYALVSASDSRWVDVVFEFCRVGNSAKWRCYGVGKADRCCHFANRKEG